MDPAKCLEILQAVEQASKHGVIGGCCADGSPLGGTSLVNALLSQGLENDTVCGECGTEPPPFAPPPRGQVIDLETGENELSASLLLEHFPALKEKQAEYLDIVVANSSMSVNVDAKQAEDGREEGANADERIVARLVKQLRDVAPALLVKQVAHLHEQRVAVHKAYEGAFKHLWTAPGGGAEALGRMYPFVVGCATSRFAALSQSVRAIANVLEAVAASPPAELTSELSKEVVEAAKMIRKLQGLEQERLTLVAASHLEQSKAWALDRARGDNDESQLLSLARKNCDDIKKRLGHASVSIEELVSELRYSAAELQDD